MRFLYGRIFLFVFPLTSFQWLVHYRHIHMNKYKSKKQKQSKLSLSQDLKYLKMLQGAGSHFQISPEGKKAMYSQSLKCLSVCVCTAANENVQQVFPFMSMRTDLCCSTGSWSWLKCTQSCWWWVHNMSIWCSTAGWGRERQRLIQLSAISLK